MKRISGSLVQHVGVVVQMTDIVKRSETGEGDLTALDLRRLLIGVPDDALVEVNQNDLDDPRNRGQARWWFAARWNG